MPQQSVRSAVPWTLSAGLLGHTSLLGRPACLATRVHLLRVSGRSTVSRPRPPQRSRGSRGPSQAHPGGATPWREPQPALFQQNHGCRPGPPPRARGREPVRPLVEILTSNVQAVPRHSRRLLQDEQVLQLGRTRPRLATSLPLQGVWWRENLLQWSSLRQSSGNGRLAERKSATTVAAAPAPSGWDGEKICYTRCGRARLASWLERRSATGLGDLEIVVTRVLWSGNKFSSIYILQCLLNRDNVNSVLRSPGWL
ncbi:hypothetical protein F4780DRAFT_340206 [Xylariomycetidae sp. FL0641]|nr:hypothetical protein F4780DRAFT_340206 [Xylariomycetidae sp. FL0641]